VSPDLASTPGRPATGHGPSTRAYVPRICLVFDFDKTLASSSVNAILGAIGLERDDWMARFQDPLGEGWDPLLKRGEALIRAGEAVGRPLTPDLIEATAVAGVFDRILAGAFHFEEGQATRVKRVVTHPEKALYLRALGEGLGPGQANAPGTSGAIVAEHEMHCPFDQMIYVGDGASDLQAFGFLEQAGGLTVGIKKDGAFSAAADQSADQRVENLAPPDYSPGSELLDSLVGAAQSCAGRVALRGRSWGE